MPLPLATGSPAKHRDIIGAPAHPTTIEVKKGQRLVLKMSIPAVQVAMAKASFEHTERKILDVLPKFLCQLHDVVPIRQAMCQQWLYRLEWLGEEMLKIKCEARVCGVIGIAR